MPLDSKDLIWDGLFLRLGSRRGRIVATVIPDTKWSSMWRVQIDGMVNLTRAKDEAIVLALANLNQRMAA
jgi:hypothetical protein